MGKMTKKRKLTGGPLCGICGKIYTKTGKKDKICPACWEDRIRHIYKRKKRFDGSIIFTKGKGGWKSKWRNKESLIGEKVLRSR